MVWDELGWLLEELCKRWGLEHELLRYSSSFQILWQRLVDDDLPSSPLVLVYDGIPPEYARPVSLDAIHFDSLFSPVSWYALLAAGTAVEAGRRAIPPCFIVDPHDLTDADDHEKALKKLLSPNLCCLNDRSELTVLKDSPSGMAQIAPWQGKAIRRELRALVAEPAHRHAVSNILGPLVLGVGVNELALPDSDKPALLLLQAVLRRLGLTCEPAPTDWPWIGPKQISKLAQARFVLLDDMADLGWQPFLRKALGLGEGDGRLITFCSPDLFVKALTDSNGRLRLNARLELPGVGRAAILFLDLRLFTRRPGDEFKFFQALLSIASQACDPSGLPWKGGRFAKGEVELVQGCMESKSREGDEYYVALTLLPRLISLVDPQLPIVLFASTGQRRIMEALKPYGNIITAFEKPRLFLEGGPRIAVQTRMRFEQAFRRAIRLLNGRCALDRLRHLTRTPQEQWPRAASGMRNPYVEVYFDEAGLATQQDFVVGGFALLCDGEDAANTVNNEMIRRGLRWGPTDLEPDPQPSDCLPKEFARGELRSLVLAPVADILQQGQVVGIGCCLQRGARSPIADPLDLASPACLDNVYRTLVLQALEVLLFEVLPWHLEKRPFRCGVYVATRIRTQPDAAAVSWWSQLPARYGIRVIAPAEGGPPFFQSIRSDSVYPMVAEVLTRDVDANVNVHAARGARLLYRSSRRGTVYPEELPRPAHFLADLVARFGPSASGEPLKTWLNRGFLSVADEQFARLLSACRHARAGRHVDALLEVTRAREMKWWARPRIAHSVEALSGPEFIQFCERLPRDALLWS